MSIQQQVSHLIRILGGNRDVSARASHLVVRKDRLMINEWAFPNQAEMRRLLKSTFSERKSMSTKTSFKRIALVATAALGLGVVSTVSANAAPNTTVTAISAVSAAAPSARTGAWTVIPVTVTFNVPASGTSDTYTVAAKVVSAPLTGGANGAASALGYSTTTSETDFAHSNLTFTTSAGAEKSSATYAAGTQSHGLTLDTPNTGLYAGTQGAIAAPGTAGLASATVITEAVTDKATTGKVYLAVKPDVSGTYSVLISSTVGDTQSYTSGDTSTLVTFTTVGAPANIVLTTVGGSTHTANGGVGALVKVKVTDSNGAATTLGSNDAIALSTTGGYVKKASLTSGVPASQTPTSATETLTNADFINGVAFVNVLGTAAGTAVLSATGSGTLSSGVTATTSFTVLAAASSTETSTAYASRPTGVKTGMFKVSNTAFTTSTTSTSDTIEVTWSAAATATTAGNDYWTVVDSQGKISGAPVDGSHFVSWTAGYTVAVGDTYEDFTIAHPAFTAGSARYTVTEAILNSTASVTAAAPGTSAAFTPQATVLQVAPASTVSFTALLKDEFGVAVANTAVTATITGRNGAVTPLSLVTDASGNVAITYGDTGTSSTSITSDNVAISATGATTSNVQVLYNAGAASKLTVTTPNTTASVANATVVTSPIYAGDGVENGIVAVTATVSDANGNLLIGVPVKFSVSGTGVAVPSAEVTTFTNTSGVATSHVYAWISGTYTVTATSGVATSTGSVTFGDTTGASYGRTLTIAAVGNVVTATVVDRFGNAAKGAIVYFVTTGGANIGGLLKTNVTTGGSGTASVVVSGSGTVTAYSNFDPSSAGGTIPTDQSCALAGNATCAQGATAAVAFTASTVGTTLKSETYVGGSIAPAGVNSASVDVTGNDANATAASQAAQDAANEATDAANAATDAANNAMDSADAATAAAQDAGDKADAALAAITDLATKVSDIATQVSSLSAVVAKIAAAVAKISAKVKA